MTQPPTTDKIFDKVFQSILEKMPQLMIPLINEAFHTDYCMDDMIVPFKNEHKDITQGLDRIIDFLLHIKDKKYYIKCRDKKYHIECQQMKDNTTIIRMFEYDVESSLEEAGECSNTGVQKICFPNSCELYLTHTASMEDSIVIPLRFADGYVHEYQIRVIKAQNYSVEEIFQKNLQVLLPYYILRYEKNLPEYEQNEEKKKQLFEEYKNIEKYLNAATNSEEYNSLVELIKEVLDYVLRRESRLREGIGKIMRGEVMELFSERMLRIGREKGFEEGRKLAGVEIVDKLVDAGIMDLEAACNLLEVSLQDYEKVKGSLNQENLPG